MPGYNTNEKLQLIVNFFQPFLSYFQISKVSDIVILQLCVWHSHFPI